MKLNFNRALVTGGAGFIGSHLVDALVAAGCRVAVIDSLATGAISNLEHIRGQIAFHQGDIRDRKILEKAAENCEVLFHLAAVVSVPETVANPVESACVNDLGTLYVLETARRRNVKRVVFSSSCAVYGDDPALPKQESMLPQPCSPYAVQKLTGEHYAQVYHELYGLETTSLRYFNVYGPRQDPSSPYSGVISLFMTHAVSDAVPVIFGDGHQSRDFVYVQDVVRANLLAAVADQADGQVFNVGTGRSVPIKRLWEMIRMLSGATRQPRYEPARAGDIVKSVAGTALIKKHLGFAPDYTFERGLGLTFEWYRESRRAEGARRKTDAS
ncbi:MAG: SDR family oxidoreductase [Desulfobacterales bacterium]|nr:MAG: SDR family oxidoreductase [Desulfobacterales bacterium]